MVMGAPTDYRTEFCDEIVELGKQGKSVVQMACELGVMKQTLYNWAEKHPDFLDAFNLARQYSQQWWENKGQTGLEAEKFNAGLWSKQVSCRFPHDYREQAQSNIQHLDKNGQPADPPSITDADIIARYIQQKMKEIK